MKNNLPKISIITVVYNSKENFIKTLESIKNLNYDNLEYIVIDGGSTDGTLELINSNRNIISNFISEKDSGLYDAMNKGIRIASGDYLWFINAGDTPYENEILNKIFEIEGNADFYYGDTEMIDDSGKNYGKRTLKVPPKVLTWKSFINGMIVSHQSMIIKKALAVDYNINYKFVADIDWAIRVLQRAEKIVNTKLILSKFLIGGYSRQYTIPSLKERFKMLCTHFNCFYVILNHFKLSFKFIIYIIKKRKLL